MSSQSAGGNAAGTTHAGMSAMAGATGGVAGSVSTAGEGGSSLPNSAGAGGATENGGAAGESTVGGGAGDGGEPSPPAACGDIQHGGQAARVRYRAAAVPYGHSCESEPQSASCDDGVLGNWSGTFTFEYCTQLAPSDCGDTPHAQLATRTRYQAATVPFGSDCESQEQSALCSNGNLGPWTGSHAFDACTVGPAADCDDGSHGTSRERVRFEASSVAWDEVCQREVQTQTCSNGSWSEWTGSYEQASCAPTTPASCAGYAHGTELSRVRYQSSPVPHGASCVSETQTSVCSNGTFSDWSGSYQWAYCDVEDCTRGTEQTRACGLNGRGQQTRSCINGGWPTYWTNCIDPDVCKDGADNPDTVSCSPNPGFHTTTCVAGQWQSNDDCGACSGSFEDPCTANKTSQACFAANYEGATCGYWFAAEPRCRISPTPPHCYDITRRESCLGSFNCTWISY